MLQAPHQQSPLRQQDLLAILGQATIFSRLTHEQLTKLAHRTRLVRLDAGEVLFRRGDKARAVYLLGQGQLKLYRTSADGGRASLADYVALLATDDRVATDSARCNARPALPAALRSVSASGAAPTPTSTTVP